jgi:hypothetical protein
VRTLPGSFPAAVHGNLVAWCAFRCPTMHVTDAATGSDRVISHVGRHPWEATYGGAISADGRYLALPIGIGGTQRVALVDLRLDRSRLIWDPARDALYHATSGAGVARYRVGAGRALPLPVHVAGGSPTSPCSARARPASR